MAGASAPGRIDAAIPSPSNEPTFVELREIEIPGARIVSGSPDGRWIAAVRPARVPHESLCVYAVETLEERSCSQTGTRSAGVRPADVAWSPDGSRLAFSEDLATTASDGDLWLMDAATGQLTNLDDDGFTGGIPRRGQGTPEDIVTLPLSPAFSSDGRRIAYSRSLLVDGEFAGNDIAVVAVGGGAPERLARVSDGSEVLVVSGYLGWAPDDGAVYHSVHGTEAPDADGVWAVDTRTGERRQVASTMSEDGGPLALIAVSPRGDRLLALDREHWSRDHAGPVVTLVDARTGALEPLQPPVGDPAAAVVMPAAFSPDGAHVLLVVRMVDPDHQVHVRDVDSAVVRPLVPSGLPLVPALDPPTWATDGTIVIPGGSGDPEGAEDLAALGRAVVLTGVHAEGL
jgi:dipeptidyl aminopeptidase/acylaminoacyl peptidase